MIHDRIVIRDNGALPNAPDSGKNIIFCKDGNIYYYSDGGFHRGLRRKSTGIITLANSGTVLIEHENISSVPIVVGASRITDWGNAVLVANWTSSNNADTGQTATLSGNAAVSSGYMQFDGSGDVVTFPDSAAYTLGTSDFLIEFDFVPGSTAAGNRHIINHSTDGAPEGASPYAWSFYQSGSNINVGVEAWSIVAATIGTVSVGSNYRIAINRSGSVFRWFFNGTLVSSATNSSGITDRAGSIRFGSAVSGIENFNGKVRRFRLVVGDSVYGGSSYTPSDSDFSPASSSYSQLKLGTDYSASTSSAGTTITNTSGSSITGEFVVNY